MIHRNIHPGSSLTFQEWNDEKRPYLIRAEELGIWGQTKEWLDRYVLEFEVLEQSASAPIQIYYVYEHYSLEDTHYKSKFAYKN